MQNIPSHEKSIRMLFKASTKYHTVPLSPIGYIVPETDDSSYYIVLKYRINNLGVDSNTVLSMSSNSGISVL